MGGRGSGGHNSKSKLRDVQCARLDVHELARDGKLTLGKRGRLFGTVCYEVTGGPDVAGQARLRRLLFPLGRQPAIAGVTRLSSEVSSLKLL
jgi:hypothetical protein